MEHADDPEERKQVDVPEKQAHEGEDANAVTVASELAGRTARSRKVASDGLCARNPHLQCMDRQLGFDFEAVRAGRKGFDKAPRQRAISGKHVLRPLTEEHPEQPVEHPVSEAMTATVHLR